MTRYTPKSSDLRKRAVKGLPLEDFPQCDTHGCYRPATERIYADDKKVKRKSKTPTIICCRRCAKKILKDIKKMRPDKKIVHNN